jgi:hypothetical protein
MVVYPTKVIVNHPPKYFIKGEQSWFFGRAENGFKARTDGQIASQS